ncbi:aldo/keto reductase [Blastopirellula sp. JC732]|uniref:Aldo/keto reductase n=1 Tax=Blastopirellula sediminis TaxID=2894196 RepID=A0A9X1MPT5_9BACT|nr:aldo/keto reductase [Blastopirellula sediminis]MCC9606005.1 aldo/keto reductase [Blastopirellula sediminis]MCC9630696.1 aldo/keto reductase [Blastopirellula sediminis]
MNDTLTVAGGGKLPLVGLGTWKIDAAILPDLIVAAIEAGYRHIDCACDYGNEEAVGAGLQKALQQGLCRREDLWITSKLWNTYHRPEHVRAAAERSLRDLQIDYFDLYHIHFPIALEYVSPETRYPPAWFFDPSAAEPAMRPIAVPQAETWQAMQELKTAGLARHLGVCNFNISLLREITAATLATPAVLQVELHPYLAQTRLIRYCQQQGIAVTGYSPLGAPSYVPLGMATSEEDLLSDETILAIAEAHSKTPGQIALKWNVQRGVAVIPKTSRVQRLAENLALFDFELSEPQMKAINQLDRHRRFNDPGHFCEAAFGAFFPIYD